MRHMRPTIRRFGYIAAVLATAYVLIISIPLLLSLKAEHDRKVALEKLRTEFPVTVDPLRKTIEENDEIDAFLASEHSLLQAAAGNAGGIFATILERIAGALSVSPLYSPIAAVSGRPVTIEAGMRKEQVARTFAKALGWSKEKERQFLTATSTSLSEGYFLPGTYVVMPSATPEEARALIEERFSEEVLSRYSERVAEAVPLQDALTIASLIQREAAGPSDMRLVSGIIWNRLFVNMRLQIDATVQYARANAGTGVWWPTARPSDLFIRSPYNTYVHRGLPPGPISNPSVTAVIAALNPAATSCMFYFHDRLGSIHCSDTYEGHIALLKKHYGRGK